MTGKRAQSDWLMLQPRPDYVDHLDAAWTQEAVRAGILCPACKRRAPQNIGRPLRVTLRESPYPRPFGTTLVCLIARRDFIDALNAIGSDLLEHCTTGAVTIASGKDAPGYATLSPCTAIAIRGAGAAGMGRCCRTCRRFRYFPMPWESRHLVRGTFDESRRLHTTQVGVLAVRQEIWEEIPSVFKKKIKAWPLPVKDEPEDGIEDFPPVWP